MLALAQPLHAQNLFVFASKEQARKALGARDEYVQAMTPLERSARLHTSDAVDEPRFLAAMQGEAREWSAKDERGLQALLERLERFVSGMRWQHPQPVLLVKASSALEDGLPHTRGTAVIVPEEVLQSWSADGMAFLLAHETFHVLSRQDAVLREQLYNAIGFRRCATMLIPASLERLRITNPDAPVIRHTVRVRVRGVDAEAIPFLHFDSASPDPRVGFKKQVQISWLLVERQGDGCRATLERYAPAQLEGLEEQIGRNSPFPLHPEEILADNFALLFVLGGSAAPAKKIPSPELLQRLAAILVK